MGPPAPPQFGLRNRQDNTVTFSTNVPKPDKFVHTGNFARFCQRFKQYIRLGRIRGPNIHFLLLGMVDDITYAKLEKI